MHEQIWRIPRHTVCDTFSRLYGERRSHIYSFVYDAVTINKCIPQQALLKAMQHTSSILGSAIQRGLAKEAHAHGHVENNEFASINKHCFTYDDGVVHIDYSRLLLSIGVVAQVEFTRRSVDGLHVELLFDPCINIDHANPDDVVFVYAVEYQIEVCQLVACVNLSRYLWYDLWPAPMFQPTILLSTRS